MKITVTLTEAQLLMAAGNLAQDNMNYAEMTEVAALVERIRQEAGITDDTIRVGEPADREIDLGEREIGLLHNELANGRRWAFSKWTPEIKAMFGGLIDKMEGALALI